MAGDKTRLSTAANRVRLRSPHKTLWFCLFWNVSSLEMFELLELKLCCSFSCLGHQVLVSCFVAKNIHPQLCYYDAILITRDWVVRVALVGIPALHWEVNDLK